MKREGAVIEFLQTVNEISVLEDNTCVLEKIISVILRISGAERACIYAVANDGESALYLLAGSHKTGLACGHIIEKIASLAIKNKATVSEDELRGIAAFEDYPDEINHLKAVFCMPVIYRNRIKSVLYLDSSTDAFSFLPENIPLINALVIQALAINLLTSENEDGKDVRIDQKNFENMCRSFLITEKEQKVLLLMIKDFTKKQIAEDRSISVNTVKHHISNIYKKTGVSSREELIDIFLNINMQSG